MATIKIEWSTDSWDCETCGGSYADGAIVCIDDKTILDEPASAHCYDSSGASESQVIEAINTALGASWGFGDNDWDLSHYYKFLEELGHTVELSFEDYSLDLEDDWDIGEWDEHPEDYESESN